MENSGRNIKRVYKLNKRNFLITSLLALGVFMITLGGLFSTKSIFSSLRSLLDDNQKLGEKTITPNKIGNQPDGTYKLSLTVTGEAEKQPNHVNVIVIVDRSGSMSTQSGTGAYVATDSTGNGLYGLVDGEYVPLTRQGSSGNRTFWYNGVQYTGQRYQYDSTATRLQATQAAVNGLASSLLAYNEEEGNDEDTVEMALVSFATSARTDRNPTTSASSFMSSVNSLNANGGTNWEAALQEANGIDFDDEDPTYVIFFSDGSPTFHSSDGGYRNWNNTYNVYGTGQEQEPNMERSYTQAVDDATTLANKVGANNFYTIFAYGTTTGSGYMSSLTTAAGAPAGNNYSASSTAELQDAFDEILESIEMAGISSVSIEDGTTNKVAKTSETGVASLLEVDKNSFQYWRTKDGVREEWKSTDDPAPPAAHFAEETGKVSWDLSSLGVLENDVTYEVTFDVYPSQETYDLIADLKNGEVDYDTEVDPAIKKYLHKNGDSYSLATNTVDKDGNSTATITYTDTRTDDGEQTYNYTNPDPVATDASSISIKKTWDNNLDSRTERPVNVNLQRDGENFLPAELNSDNNFELEDIAIAVGLARLNGEKLTVLDVGHDYKFAELGSESFNWELETQTVHPMLINGEIKKLILVEDTSTIPSEMGSKTYYDGYYKIGNKVYKDEGAEPTINAINHRRSNLNIKKLVDGENANPNDEFEFTITVIQEDKDGKELADDTSTTDDDLWFSVYDNGYVDLGSRLVSSEWEKSVNEAGDIYYHAANHTQLVVKLKANENLRFVNIVSNTDFTVVEGNTANYELEDITASGFSTAADSTDSTTINTGTKTITGHIGENNKSYQVEYTNKNTNPETVEATVKKVWQDAENQDGKRPETLTVTLSDGRTATLSESNKWEATITGLPKYKNGEVVKYTWTEETLPKGYTMTSNETEGTVTTITNSYTPEETEATIVKAWDDDKDRDKVRPDSIKVTLTSSDPYFEAREVTLSKDEWTETITKLPKYEHGKLAVYTWTEDTAGLPAGYAISDTSVNGTVTTITNHRDVTPTEATVKKVWDDANNQDGKRPTSITAKLLGNGVAVQKDGKDVVAELTAGNQWTVTVEDLPLNDNGEAINYTWSEDEAGLPTGYKLTGTSKEGTVTTLTNSYTPDTTERTIVKVWDDASDQDGKRPEALPVSLNNGVSSVDYSLKPNEKGEWTLKVSDLPKYRNGGEEITYTWTESEKSLPEGYKLTNTEVEGTVTTLTNSYTPETETITVTKIWDDKSDQDGKRPEDVTFTVTGSDGNTYEAKFSGEGDTWTKEVVVDKYYDGGQKVTFTVDEAEVKDYKKSINNENLTITNSYTPDTTERTIVKVWDDASDQDGKRPEALPVSLNNGVSSVDYSLKPNEKGEWTLKVSDLPKYRNGGEEITYTWTESEKSLPEGYKLTNTEVEGTVTTLTNSYTPETETITVTKIWDDKSDQDGKRPEDVTFTVTGSDGNTYEAKFSGEGDTWTKEVVVDKYYDGGQKVTFTVDEAEVKDYKKSINNENLTITNSYTPVKDKITVTKIWDDASDQDGKRPGDVTFTVTGSDEKTYEATLSGEGDTWTQEVVVDKYYDGGQKVTFEVDEEEVADYTKSINNEKLTITNSYTPEVTEATIVKVWDDDGDRDGKQPTTLNVTLSNGAKVILSESNNWTQTVTGLPKYANGQEIDYRWTEEDLADYTIRSNGKEGTVQTITNHYDPELTYVCVKKVWDDDENRDNIRPGSLTVVLSDGTEVLLNEQNGWAGRVDNLFKYQNHGELINYTWSEKDLPEGYTLSGTDTASDENEAVITTLTNTHNIVPTEATVKKVWDDNGDQDGKRPETLKVQLLGDNQPVKKDNEDVIVTLSESTGWSATVEDLPLNDKGTAIEYTWSEVDLPDAYTLTNTAVDGTVTTLTNTHAPEKIDIPVKKEWVNNDPYGFGNPASVVVNLLDNGEVVGTKTLSAGNNWAYTFTGLDKYRGGKEIPYEVKEEAVLDYDTEYKGSIAEGFTVVNTYNPTLIPVVEVTKVWDDANDQDGVRPKSIQMTLVGKVNGEVKYTSEAATVTDADYQNNNTWKYTFTDLPERYLGQKIEYSVIETLENGSPYTGTSVSNVEIKNHYDPQTITFNIYKDWDDNDNNDGKRPKSVTVHLLQDGTEIETLTITEEDGWAISFGPLPKFRDHGVEIDYTVIEDPVEYYENTATTYDKDSEKQTTDAIVVNTHENEKAKIEITKIWKDDNNKYNYRPKSIEVEIYTDGELAKTVTLDASNNWKIVVTDLDKYAAGKEIEYTIKEKSVAHYTTVIAGTAEDGFTITNTVENPPEITPPNTSIEGIGEAATDKYIALLMTILAMFASAGIRRVFE